MKYDKIEENIKRVIVLGFCYGFINYVKSFGLVWFSYIKERYESRKY